MSSKTNKNAVTIKNQIVEFVREYYKANNLKGAVLGISGGKDSAVVAALMCEAIGAENVVGLTLPCHSKSKDARLAKMVSKRFGFRLINIDLTKAFDALTAEIDKTGKYTSAQKKNSDINLKPRLRMSTVYYMAALLSNTESGVYIVPGTSNACELHVGYFTKGGDNVFDIGTICGLTVDEVIAVGEVLDVPREVLYRTPDDGLSGKSDEEKMGVKYVDISKVVRGKKVAKKEYDKIEKLHKGSRHKFDVPKFELKK